MREFTRGPKRSSWRGPHGASTFASHPMALKPPLEWSRALQPMSLIVGWTADGDLRAAFAEDGTRLPRSASATIESKDRFQCSSSHPNECVDNIVFRGFRLESPVRVIAVSLTLGPARSVGACGCILHLVPWTAGRRLDAPVLQNAKALLDQPRARGIQEGNLMSDHVHIVISTPPK
jgi:hypothetical protein